MAKPKRGYDLWLIIAVTGVALAVIFILSVMGIQPK